MGAKFRNGTPPTNRTRKKSYMASPIVQLHLTLVTLKV